MALGRVMALAMLLAAAAGCQRLGLARQYEYDERLDLSLDGSAIVDVNASLAALAALRGADFDVDPEARFDRQAARRLFEGPGTVVREVSTYRRHRRRFVHVQIAVASLAQLPAVAPLAWSHYVLARQDQEFRFLQDIGPPAGKPVGDVGWDGRELVAFRLHLPSRIHFHNSPNSIERGNILVWEQTLQDRLKGVPLNIEARMDTESILYQTVWLFGGTFLAALTLLAMVVWWIGRKGRRVVPA
jgi:hypothetical protein